MLLKKHKDIEFNIIYKDCINSLNVYQCTVTNDWLKDVIRNPIKLNEKSICGFKPSNVPIFKLGYAEGEFVRNQANLNDIKVTGISHLILEYDNKGKYPNLIDKFVEKFEEYEWYLYTTKSSTIKANAFRVIIPLKRMISPSDVWFNKDRLIEMFCIEYGNKKIYADSSCFKNYQRVPIYYKQINYRYEFNEGKRLNLFPSKEYNIHFRRYKDEMDMTKEELDALIKEGENNYLELVEDGLEKKFHNTPLNKKQFKEYCKKWDAKRKERSLAEQAIDCLEKHNKEKNHYEVASILAWLNSKRDAGCKYSNEEIMNAYREIRGKEMSMKAFKKYLSYLKKCGG